MENNETDIMLKTFFSERIQEIPDSGFTLRVMRKLPEQADRIWIVWVFAAFGMAISMYFGLNLGLVQHTFKLLENIPIYYLLAGIFSFPLVGIVGYFFTQNKKFELF